MREIVLDTETTGLRQNDGDRIVEIGCVELVNHVATGNNYHQYINPQRNMPEEAFSVHGLSEDFLSSYPVMAEVVDAFLAFIGDSAPLIIHNAEFDMRFINAELNVLGKPLLLMSRSIDTVSLARKKFPGSPVNLNALCRRFSIDNAAREQHGALLDAKLLAEVYLELIGGRQSDFKLASDVSDSKQLVSDKQHRVPRDHCATESEKLFHDAFLGKIEKPVWKT
jgi:DNA polymerase-3 subunit epsilon